MPLFFSFSPYPLRCTIGSMSIKIPAEVWAAMREISRKFGRMGGKAAARNMTPEERSARATKASAAAARKRTAERLARERAARRSARARRRH